jgi:hypothetical protein
MQQPNIMVRVHTPQFVFLRSVRLLLVMTDVLPSSPILVTLMMETLCSSATSVLTRTTWRNIPEDSFRQPRSPNYATVVLPIAPRISVTSLHYKQENNVSLHLNVHRLIGCQPFFTTPHRRGVGQDLSQLGACTSK